MHVNEYGNAQDETVILLAPMMVSGAELYDLLRPHFRGNYHVIAPDQGGHGKAGAYLSADDEYRTLKQWLLAHHCTSIKLLYGASLGVAVAWRLLFDPDLTVERAWFDGVALCGNARFAEAFMKRMFKSKKKQLAKTPVEASGSLVKMYGHDFAKMMTQNFKRITPSDIDAICRACCHYQLRPVPKGLQQNIHLDFGEKDFDLWYSKKTIPRLLPYAALSIRPGFAHCGYMAAHPKDYAEELEQFANAVQPRIHSITHTV